MISLFSRFTNHIFTHPVRSLLGHGTFCHDSFSLQVLSSEWHLPRCPEPLPVSMMAGNCASARSLACWSWPTVHQQDINTSIDYPGAMSGIVWVIRFKRAVMWWDWASELSWIINLREEEIQAKGNRRRPAYTNGVVNAGANFSFWKIKSKLLSLTGENDYNFSQWFFFSMYCYCTFWNMNAK